MTRMNFQEFHKFVQTKSEQEDTWRFWAQFVFQDALAYIDMFLAIRSGNWTLRTASLKLMALVFTAFDQPSYQKLISQHIADVLTISPTVITAFKQGAFVVSISGRPWHSVAIDEAHEMPINKECKATITRPTPDYIDRIAHYLPYRTKSSQNAKKRLLPDIKTKESISQSPFSVDSNIVKFEKKSCIYDVCY